VRVLAAISIARLEYSFMNCSSVVRDAVPDVTSDTAAHAAFGRKVTPVVRIATAVSRSLVSRHTEDLPAAASHASA